MVTSQFFSQFKFLESVHCIFVRIFGRQRRIFLAAGFLGAGFLAPTSFFGLVAARLASTAPPLARLRLAKIQFN